MLNTFAQDVLSGLGSLPKSLPSHCLYNSVGSAIFQSICEMPEYPLYRAERENLHHHGPHFANLLPDEFLLIEPGAGDCTKTCFLIDALLRSNKSFSYIPADIDGATVAEATTSVTAHFGSKVAVKPKNLEFTELLAWIATVKEQIVMPFLGSTIGNFGANGASQKLHAFREVLKRGDHVLLGFALDRDPKLIQLSYSDPKKITASFNLNLLTRMNKELGATFDLKAFCHWTRYDRETKSIHSYLMSLRNQRIFVEQLGEYFEFMKGELIKTESSTQYTIDEMVEIAREAGFAADPFYCDHQLTMCDMLLTAT